MLRRLALATLPLLLIAPLAACNASEPDDAGDSPSSQAPGSQASGSPSSSTQASQHVAVGFNDDPATVDPELLGSLEGFHTGAITDEVRHIHATWPEVPGQAPLTKAVRARVRSLVDDFRDEYPAPEPGQVAIPELNVQWRLIGSSDDAIGVVTDEFLNAGGSAGTSARSLWWDAKSARVRPNSDLVEDPQALRAVVRSALEKNDDIATSELDEALSDELPVVAFTAEGELFVGFDEYQVAAGSMGTVSVTIPREQTDELLSDFGEAARESALDASTPHGAPSTEPTSSPSTERPAAVNCKKLKCIAITYDDGPAGHTGDLLDTYAKRNAVATFFALGQQIQTFPDTTKRIVKDGHELGLHTWDHKDLTSLAPAQVRSEIKRTLDLAEKTTGERPTLLRPPYGATNDQVRAQERKLGLAQVLWSIDTLDWKDRNTDVVVQRVLKQARRNSIVLMHDIHETTVRGADRIIVGLRKRGFELVTVSQLVGEPKPGVSYP